MHKPKLQAMVYDVLPLVPNTYISPTSEDISYPDPSIDPQVDQAHLVSHPPIPDWFYIQDKLVLKIVPNMLFSI